MINELEIIKYDRTDEELEELLLFLIAVAGKNAATTARMLDSFLHSIERDVKSPFDKIRYFSKHGIDHFKESLKKQGFGCQTRLAQAFNEASSSGLNLRTCSRDDLLEIHGIGMKSANCFISWTRKGSKLAMLDTHLLAEMKELNLAPNIPKATPSSKKQYERLEKVWLDYCASLKVDPTEYDLQVWLRRSSSNKKSHSA